MHGGVKVYRGTAAAARNYVEADRSRADDYYLVEGMGVARRYAAGPDRPVVELASLTGDGYEAGVAGLDPESGQPRGRVRAAAKAGGCAGGGGVGPGPGPGVRPASRQVARRRKCGAVR